MLKRNANPADCAQIKLKGNQIARAGSICLRVERNVVVLVSLCSNAQQLLPFVWEEAGEQGSDGRRVANDESHRCLSMRNPRSLNVPSGFVTPQHNPQSAPAEEVPQPILRYRRDLAGFYEQVVAVGLEDNKTKSSLN